MSLFGVLTSLPTRVRYVTFCEDNYHIENVIYNETTVFDYVIPTEIYDVTYIVECIEYRNYFIHYGALLAVQKKKKERKEKKQKIQNSDVKQEVKQTSTKHNDSQNKTNGLKNRKKKEPLSDKSMGITQSKNDFLNSIVSKEPPLIHEVDNNLDDTTRDDFILISSDQNSLNNKEEIVNIESNINVINDAEFLNNNKQLSTQELKNTSTNENLNEEKVTNISHNDCTATYIKDAHPHINNLTFPKDTNSQELYQNSTVEPEVSVNEMAPQHCVPNIQKQLPVEEEFVTIEEEIISEQYPDGTIVTTTTTTRIIEPKQIDNIIDDINDEHPETLKLEKEIDIELANVDNFKTIANEEKLEITSEMLNFESNTDLNDKEELSLEFENSDVDIINVVDKNSFQENLKLKYEFEENPEKIKVSGNTHLTLEDNSSQSKADNISNFSTILSDEVLSTAFLEVNNDNTNKMSTIKESTNDNISPSSLFIVDQYVDSVLKKTFIQSYNDIKFFTKDKRHSNGYTNCLKKDCSIQVVNKSINTKNGLKNNSKVTENLQKNKKIFKEKVFSENNNLIQTTVDTLTNNILTEAQYEYNHSLISKEQQDYNINNYADDLVKVLLDETSMSFKNLSLRRFSLKTFSKKNDGNNDKTKLKRSESNDTRDKDNKKVKELSKVFLKQNEKETKEKTHKELGRENSNSLKVLPLVNEINAKGNKLKEHDLDGKPMLNGIHKNTDIIEENENIEIILNGHATPSEKIQTLDNENLINESNLTVTDGEKHVDKDQNQNVVKHDINNKKCRPISDRPLSGFAEKLAELLADEEEDLEFFDSEEELHESLEKMKENFVSKPSISVEIDKMQRRYSIDELNDYGSKKLKSQVNNKKTTKRKNYRKRGDRPKSLFDQDMLLDFLNTQPEMPLSDDENKNVMSDTDEEEEEEEIQPVQATIELFENTIPLLPEKDYHSNSTTAYDYAFDEILKTQRRFSVSAPSGKTPTLRKAAVIDIGCGVLKAGICGEAQPSCYCPSVIGTPRRFSQDVSKMKKGYYVGDEAWSYAGMLQIDHPIQQNITNWTDVTNMMEHLLEHELHINDSEHPIMLTEMSLTSKKNRERITEIMFESFGIPAFYLANQGVLALYSMGLVSGLCLNSGFYTTQAIPVYEGHPIPYATKQLDVGGDHVTNNLGRMLQGNSGFTFNTSSERLVLNSMKQAVCYVSLDPNKEEERFKESDLNAAFTLPDGQVITVGSERSMATEVLFDPQILGLQQPGTAELIPDCLNSMDADLYNAVSGNILVTGGNTKLKGYSERLENELSLIYKNKKDDIKLKYSEDRILSTWIGGSVLSSIPVFRDQWITMDTYAEHGSKIVHRLCF